MFLQFILLHVVPLPLVETLIFNQQLAKSLYFTVSFFCRAIGINRIFD